MNRGYRVIPLSRAALRDAAGHFRKVLGLSNHPWFPIVDVYEWRLPQVWPEFHFEVAEVDEMGANHALAYPGEARVVVREDIYHRACDGQGRDRFTLCHELGHLVLEHSLALAFSGSDPILWKPYEDSEWQANVFAAELMMPSGEVRLSRTPDELAERCGVSVSAAITQRRLLTRKS